MTLAKMEAPSTRQPLVNWVLAFLEEQFGASLCTPEILVLGIESTRDHNSALPHVFNFTKFAETDGIHNPVPVAICVCILMD